MLSASQIKRLQRLLEKNTKPTQNFFGPLTADLKTLKESCPDSCFRILSSDITNVNEAFQLLASEASMPKTVWWFQPTNFNELVESMNKLKSLGPIEPLSLLCSESQFVIPFLETFGILGPSSVTTPVILSNQEYHLIESRFSPLPPPRTEEDVVVAAAAAKPKGPSSLSVKTHIKQVLNFMLKDEEDCVLVDGFMKVLVTNKSSKKNREEIERSTVFSDGMKMLLKWCVVMIEKVYNFVGSSNLHSIRDVAAKLFHFPLHILLQEKGFLVEPEFKTKFEQAFPFDKSALDNMIPLLIHYINHDKKRKELLIDLLRIRICICERTTVQSIKAFFQSNVFPEKADDAALIREYNAAVPPNAAIHGSLFSDALTANTWAISMIAKQWKKGEEGPVKKEEKEDEKDEKEEEKERKRV